MVLVPSDRMESLFSPWHGWVIGAGPSGLAVAASLREQGVPFLVLEREDCIASLWQRRTYERLKLHLPKQFCQLPGIPFPARYPEHPTGRQLAKYLEIRDIESELGGRSRARGSCEPRRPAPRGSPSSHAGRRKLWRNGDRDPRQRSSRPASSACSAKA